MQSLRVQLLIGHLLLVLLVALVMVDATGDLLSISDSFDIVLTKRISLVDSTQRMREALSQQRSGLGLIGAGKLNQGNLLYDSGDEAFTEDLSDANRKSLGTRDRLELRQVSLLHKTLDKEVAEMMSAAPQSPQWVQSYNDSVHVYSQLTDTIHRLTLRNQKAIFGASARAQKVARKAYVKSIIVTFAAIFVALLLSNRIVNIVLKPLREIVGAVESLGQDPKLTTPNKAALTTTLPEFQNLKASLRQLEHRLDEMRLLEAERLNQAKLMAGESIKSLSEPVITSDANGKVVMMNEAAQSLFGPLAEGHSKSIDEAIGNSFVADSLHDALSQQALEPADALPSTPVRLKVRDQVRYYRINANPILKGDQILGAVAVLEDVTSWRELDEMKNNFIEVASHELRTPVTSLLLSTELLKEGAAGVLTEKQSQLIETQLQDLRRLQKMMKDLLDAARLGYKQKTPEFKPIAASDIINKSIEAVASIAQEQNIALVTNVEDFSFEADGVQLIQVLTNLLENALRHSPHGKSVVVHARKEANEVRFSVEDEGKGIPQKYLNNIFERFVQVPGATSGGAGLGLSIAKSIVEAHGGWISVKSQQGQGSVFTFAIPIRPAI